MTREEALDLIEGIRHGSVDALGIVLNILEQEPYICDTCKHKGDGWDTEPCDGCCGNHSGYEPCDDAISRQAVDEIKELMTDINGDTVYAVRMSDIRQLPSVNPQPCDDAISREDAIKAVYGMTRYTGIDEAPYEYAEHVISELPSVTQKSGKCKDCKWWRDSDGVYRRGVKAESKCPINTVSVANGWGYCYMFEPQEK